MSMTSRASGFLFLPILVLAFASLTSSADSTGFGLSVKSHAAGTTLSLDGARPFHQTANEVIGERLIGIENTPVRVAFWTELLPEGGICAP